MIIDFHAHIFPPEMISDRENYFDDENFRLLYCREKSRMTAHPGLLEMMESAGVDRAVCMGFPWINDRYRKLQNEYLGEIAAGSGDKIAVFMSPPAEGDVKAGVRSMAENGASGIGEVAFYSTGFGPGEEKYLAYLFEAAEEASLPLCIHVNEPVGRAYDGKYDPSLGRLYGLIEKFPCITIVLSHWGGGLFFYELMPDVRGKFARVFYDTAASPLIYGDGVYAAARDIVGGEQILFGSDFPLLGPERYIARIRNTFTGNAAERVLNGNARDILGL